MANCSGESGSVPGSTAAAMLAADSLEAFQIGSVKALAHHVVREGIEFEFDRQHGT